MVVGINSDEWLIRKKNFNLLKRDERKIIIENLELVDKVIYFNDDDGSATDAINKCLKFSKKVIFANGGDRTETNIPELDKFRDSNVQFIFGVGGNHKINSSSDIVENCFNRIKTNANLNIENYEEIESPWGSNKLLLNGDSYKIKLLEIEPNQKISLQKHEHRCEHWIIAEGIATIYYQGDIFEVGAGNHFFVAKNAVHRIENNTNSKLLIFEAQFGKILKESDIIRFEDEYNR